MTKRLFDTLPNETTFTASVVKSGREADRFFAVLDQTLFYPTSGGQPHDTGLINGIEVTDVAEKEGEILHYLTEKIEEGLEVTGSIDWARRNDHKQQHSGQHILSQVFYQTLKADTIGFHLGRQDVTIDLNVPVPSVDHLHEVEALANDIVRKNFGIKTSLHTPETVYAVPLRKPPVNQTEIRIVEVAGFDYSACCGTHVSQTGEIGLIKIIKAEKYKGGCRITFLCGQRALADYQKRLEILKRLSERLSVPDAELADQVTQLQEKNKAALKQIKALQEELMSYQAQDLVFKAEVYGETKFVAHTETNGNPKSLQQLVRTVIASPKICMMVVLEGETWQVVLGRSQDVNLDVRPFVQQLCDGLNGRGGGSPSLAQASGPSNPELSNQVQLVKQALIKALETLH